MLTEAVQGAVEGNCNAIPTLIFGLAWASLVLPSLGNANIKCREVTTYSKRLL